MTMTDTTTFEAATFTALGTPREPVMLPAELFDGTVNMPVMHRAVKAYLANQREGNASTKTRGLVTGGNQKPWKQKGTGRARQGSTRSPLWPGGGTVFGPLPRSYDEKLPRKMRALARKSAFNARAHEAAIFVIDQFRYDAPKTRTLVGLLERLGVAGQKVLVLTDGLKPNVYLSGRNLPNVQVMRYGDVSTYHVLWSDAVLIEAAAIGHALSPVAETEDAGRRASRAERKAANPRSKSAASGPPAKKTKAGPRAAKAKTPARKQAAGGAARRPAKKALGKAPKKAAPKKKGK
jgi:large subunit ribosomal protein L4